MAGLGHGGVAAPEMNAPEIKLDSPAQSVTPSHLGDSGSVQKVGGAVNQHFGAEAGQLGRVETNPLQHVNPSSDFGHQSPERQAVKTGHDHGVENRLAGPGNGGPEKTAEPANKTPDQAVANTEGTPQPQPAKGGLDQVMDWAKEHPVMAAAAAAAAVYVIQMLLKQTLNMGGGGSIGTALLGGGAALAAPKLMEWMKGKKEDPAKAAAVIDAKNALNAGMAKDPALAKLVQDHPGLNKVAEAHPEVIKSITNNPACIEALSKNPAAVDGLIRDFGPQPEKTMLGSIGSTIGKGTLAVANPGAAALVAFSGPSAEKVGTERNINLALAMNPAFAEAAAKNPKFLDGVRANPVLLQSVFQDGNTTKAFLSNPENLASLNKPHKA